MISDAMAMKVLTWLMIAVAFVFMAFLTFMAYRLVHRGEDALEEKLRSDFMRGCVIHETEKRCGERWKWKAWRPDLPRPKDNGAQ